MKMKIALCIFLTLFAALSLTVVLGSVGVLDAAAAGEEYLLREHEGYIAIYYPAETKAPTTMTDIRVSDLPLTDRLELKNGVGAADYAAVVQLLEDYGA